MIRFQQGRLDDGQQWRKKADDWIAANNPKDVTLLALATEMDTLIRPEVKSTFEPKSVTHQHHD